MIQGANVRLPDGLRTGPFIIFRPEFFLFLGLQEIFAKKAVGRGE